MAKSVETSSQRKPAPTGVLYIYHALAFSTLLSSQETDAHRVPNFRSSLGATLLIYPVFPSCQIGAGSQLIEPVRQIWLFGNSRAISLQPLRKWCDTHAKHR